MNSLILPLFIQQFTLQKDAILLADFVKLGERIPVINSTKGILVSSCTSTLFRNRSNNDFFERMGRVSRLLK